MAGKNLSFLHKLGLWVSLLTLGTCATGYNAIIQDTEKLYYSGNYDAAIPKIRSLANDSDNKDRLLYLMEAGMIFHTKGDYESSNKAFMDAENVADNIKVSVTRQGLSFLLSDNESNFTGEDFERVLIKFYIALNYIFLGEFENAKIYFRRLDVELREMKYVQGKYKQNLFARYLDAVLSETLSRYNDARVQYKNILEIEPSFSQIKGDKYVLAVKENDSRTQAALASNQNLVTAFNRNMQPVPYNTKMGEVIIINQAGKAAVKESRGKLLNDQFFASSLKVSLDSSIRAKGGASSAGVTASGVLAMMASAENPIPIYKVRDPKSAAVKPILLGGRQVGTTTIMNDYSDTAMKSFNENYNTIVAKNVASIAVKLVAAAIASEALSKEIKKNQKNELAGSLISLGVGLAAGYAASSTIAPDLRSWHLLPSNYQVKRMHLEPGEYTIELPGSKLPDGSSSIKVMVESGKVTFLNYRTFVEE
ncbi:COG3014 family protein [Leptospira sp. GIMC2001]|uniref:COG3014 family protein n=1 Tax=Leptospira sp. GIMC2001 TaxID=1513297 RepID=UPI0023490904|nr:hypothetical protein [Leptospira sp. GIMC2001]WCL48556.1 hypothetical protein O4O04_14775 [Leptospira sp. GIMC2001]